jgi:DNA processing protein
MSVEETKALLLMNRVTNYTARQKFELHAKFGSALGIFGSRAEAEEMYRKPFKINGKVLIVDEAMESVGKEYDGCAEQGIEILAISEARYPARLKEINDPPLVLFSRGRVEPLERGAAVAVVGARMASNAGLTLAYRIAGDLSRAGVTVVSGLASGVDFYAHRGVLEGGGATTAVLGNGIDVVYPKENAEMYAKIGRQGCLLSEYPIGTQPLKQNFPRRNRVISGLSVGVVVVEAGESSGALITARHAREQGRAVMALPGMAGSEYYSGNNKLIKEGAHLVEDASDVLERIGMAGVVPAKSSGAEKRWSAVSSARSESAVARGGLSPLSGAILRVIGHERVNIETIERILGDPVSKIASELTLLELKGFVVQHPGKNFSRVE